MEGSLVAIRSNITASINMLPGIVVPLYTTQAHTYICTDTQTHTHTYASKKKNRHTQMAGSVKAGETCFSLK